MLQQQAVIKKGKQTYRKECYGGKTNSCYLKIKKMRIQKCFLRVVVYTARSDCLKMVMLFWMNKQNHLQNGLILSNLMLNGGPF